METFFIRYRKMMLFGGIFMLLYFFYEVYVGIEAIKSNHRGAGTGTLINASLLLFVSIYVFINLRKANKQLKDKPEGSPNN